MKQTIILLLLLVAIQKSYSQKTHSALVSINQPDACIPTSFEEGDFEVVNYPNPTTQNVSIQSEYLVKKMFIIDPTGRVIYEKENLGSIFNINMSQYSKGIYQCVIITDQGVKKSKIVLQ